MRPLLAFAAVCALLVAAAAEEEKANKFRQREASDDLLGYPHLDEDALLNTKCPKHVELRWQTEVSSSIYATPLIADINSDGKLEVVVPSFVHYLEVLEGSDGDKLPGWPAFHQSNVHSSPLLYDVDKDGTREIVLATYNGVVNFFRVSGYMMMDKLEVPRRKEWRSSNQGRNNAAYRYNREGIYVKHGSRTFRDEEGKHFWLEFEIVDKYRVPNGNQAPYNVTVSLLVPGNYQGERRIVVSTIYNEPGKQRMKLPTVPVRTTGTVFVEMVDKNGFYFSDEFSLTFHMHYYKLLKWLVLLPMLGMFSVLVILRPQEGAPLPSFSRNID
ncbi:hypothetical protein ABZP36_005713 [Zizania latifolia]